MQQKKVSFIALARLLVGSANLMLAQSAAQRAINQKKLPLSVLRNSRLNSKAHDKFANFGKAKANAGLKTAATVGIPGIDSIVNWSDSFASPGFDFFGNPQSVWPYTMVGTPPESGRPVNINAPVIPVSVDLLAADGSVAVTFATGRKHGELAGLPARGSIPTASASLTTRCSVRSSLTAFTMATMPTTGTSRFPRA